MDYIKTLGEFIIEKQHDFPNASGDLSALLSCIQLAGKVVNNAINKAGLLDFSGASDTNNIHGESQQKLDILANETFKKALSTRRLVCGIASEEEDHIVIFKEHENVDAKYVVLLDPLDGSSNIDVNVSVGTIFSIYHRVTPVGTPITEADFLQPGRAQVAAGYIIYGSSTMLVYSTGNGVHGFTYDASLGSFCLSHESIKIPSSGKIYSINEGNYLHFPEGVKKYIKYCQCLDESPAHPYSSRYVGSLVADFHRNLLLGGIFMYPQSQAYPKGKLRLLYECNPIAYLAEQASGMGSNGYSSVLDIEPSSLHERSPFFTGSIHMVEKLHELIEIHN